ncbi:unnamed protein product [Linum trigynum]|uniref:Uncharacterized protein n=1 Tax=Linum trigynum TaxID=586398 RepID=A0AAV2ECF0_9ROSI
MDEERKRNGVAYLSEVYNASLKAGIDSPNRAGQFRNNREGEGTQSSQMGTDRLRTGEYHRRGEGIAEVAAQGGGLQEERNLQIPLVSPSGELTWSLKIEKNMRIKGE